MSDLKIFRLDGAYSQVGELDTAFSGGRSPRFAVFIGAMASDSGVLVAERTWARNLWGVAPAPSVVVARATSTPSTSSARTGYGAAYGSARKGQAGPDQGIYDPDNVFHHNANIKPA